LWIVVRLFHLSEYAACHANVSLDFVILLVVVVVVVIIIIIVIITTGGTDIK